MKKRLLSILMVCMMLIGTFSTGLSTITASAIDLSDSNLKRIKNYIERSGLIRLNNSGLTDDDFEFLLSQPDWDYSKLKDISISNNPMLTEKSLYLALEKLPMLISIDVSSCSINDISNLPEHHNLLLLDVSYNNLNSLSGIERLQELTNIYAECCNLTNVSQLARLNRRQELRYLYLSNNNISDISWLKDVKIGYRLDLRYNNISTIEDMSWFINAFARPTGIFDISHNNLFKYAQELRNLKTANNYTNFTFEPFDDSEIKLIPDDIRTLYFEDVTIDNDTKTITFNSREGSEMLVCYNFGDYASTKDFSFIIPQNENVELYAKYRYKFTKPTDSETITTTMTVHDKKGIYSDVQYTLVVNFIQKPVTISESEFRMIYTPETPIVDNDASTITLSAKEGLDYLALYNIGVTKDVTFTIDEDDCVDKYSTYRYKITKPVDSNQYVSKITVTTKDGTRDYDLIVNFTEKPVTISASEFRMLYTPETPIVDNTAKTITLTSKAGLDYLALYNVGTTNGVTFNIAEDDCVDKYSTYRYKITKPVDSNVYTSKITVTTTNGTAVYDLVVNFV